MSKVIGYRVEANLEVNKRLRSRKDADAYLEKIEARLKEANKVCDGEIWTSIELIYESRLDWCTARLAAAMIFPAPDKGKP